MGFYEIKMVRNFCSVLLYCYVIDWFAILTRNPSSMLTDEKHGDQPL
jgi:hypothetical protein